MSQCNGSPAQERGAEYISGTLSNREMERFEDHFFTCGECFEQVQVMMAAGQALIADGVKRPAERARVVSILRRRYALAGLAAAACLLAAAYFAVEKESWRPAPEQVAHMQDTPSPISPMAGPASDSLQVTNLADLSLPAYRTEILRGGGVEGLFAAGMQAYSDGNCTAAVNRLAQVPDTSDKADISRFYLGACQLQLGELAGARKSLEKVAANRESPRLEGALYLLAQISLKSDDPAGAHRYLLQTIALKGDFEARARAEDAKVSKLLHP